VINARTQPGWQEAKLIEKTPSVFLANGGKYSPEVVDGYLTAMGEPGKPIPITAVPWYAWWRQLLVWGAIITLILLGVISLSLIVHPQWAARERLRYPLAELAISLFSEDERGRTAIFSERAFWVGLTIFLLIRFTNGLHDWFPKFIQIPLAFDFSAIRTKMPVFMQTPNAGFLARPTIYPAAVGLAFLLASDIAFSLGISNIVTVLIYYGMISSGLDVSRSYMTGGVMDWQGFGAFLGFAVMLVYIGRRYYWKTLKQAITFIPQPETETASVWACRSLIVCMAGVVGILVAVGLDWPLAVLSVACMMLVFVVCARLTAECGIFFFKPVWMISGIVAGMFGLTTLGPKAIIIIGLFIYALTFDAFECLMPFAVNGLKILSSTTRNVGRVAPMLGLALVLTLVVAVPIALWSDYNLRPDMRTGGSTAEVYNAAQRAHTQLTLAGEAERVSQYSSWDRLKNMHPSGGFLVAVGIGFSLLILFSLLRLRYTWWPLHPVLILGFGAWTVAKFSTSFFIGWFLKTVITRFGGAAAYRRVRPLMIGVIAGDLTGVFILKMVSWVYYAITGTSGTGAHAWYP
jgi:hypothetical protein